MNNTCVYGDLAKLLIQKYNFTGEQVTEVWNLSDGPGDHVNHKPMPGRTIWHCLGCGPTSLITKVYELDNCK